MAACLEVVLDQVYAIMRSLHGTSSSSDRELFRAVRNGWGRADEKHEVLGSGVSPKVEPTAANFSQAEIQNHVVRSCDSSKGREKTGLTNCIFNLRTLATAIKLSQCQQAKQNTSAGQILFSTSKLSLSVLELAQLQGCQEMFLTLAPSSLPQNGPFSLQDGET